MDVLSSILKDVDKRDDREWTPNCRGGSVGSLFDNLDTAYRLNLFGVLRRLAARHNQLLKRIQQLEGAPPAQQLTATDPAVAALEARLVNLESSLDATIAARAKTELALADLAARCNVLSDRYQSAIDQHLEALTQHFGSGFSELAAARELIAQTATDTKEAVSKAAAILDEVRDEYAAARDAIPRLADQAVRTLVSTLEEEPGILALALGNAQSFTSTIAKTVER